VTPHFPKAHDGKEFPVLRFSSVPTFIAKDYSLGLPDIAFKTFHRLETMHLDLVHSHCPFASGTLALMIARKKDIPLVATFHTKYADDFAQRLKTENAGKIVARYTAKYYSQADEVWAANSSTAKTLQAYGYRGPVTVMPNGCDFEPTERTETNRRSVLREYALADKPLLLFVGRLVEQKNVGFLLKALSMLKQGHDFTAMLVGDGEGAAAYKKLAAALGIADRVKFAGIIRDREKLRGIYAAADLLTLPSTYDTDSLVKREAASCGCPSALIAGSNAAEGIEDGVNGFTSELDEGAYAALLGRALSNPELARAAGESARKTVYIPWEKVIDRVAGEYRRVIEEFNEKKALGGARRRYHAVTVALAQEMLGRQAVRIKFATESRDRDAQERRALVRKKNLKKIKNFRAKLMEGVWKRSL